MCRVLDATDYAESQIGPYTDNVDVMSDIHCYLDDNAPELYQSISQEADQYFDVNIIRHSEGPYNISFQLECQISDELLTIIKNLYPEDYI